MGRTTDYRPEMCDKVIEWGRQGKSRTWICASLDIAKQTLYRWEKEHAEFSDALSRAKVLEQMWWEDAGQDGMVGEKFNGQVWGRSMAARFPDEWREKTAVVGDANEPPVQLTVVTGVVRGNTEDR